MCRAPGPGARRRAREQDGWTMSREKFDPNPDRDPGSRGGLDRFLAPPGLGQSPMPPEMTDGKVEDGDAPEDNELSHEARSAADAAKSLEAMTEPHPGEEGTTSQG